ncbi:hypothetical protein SAMN05216564_108133 [Halopenitus persicus]|uniref:Uncharacterized protein n=1 Tax=Halopenitus persicus TaxID=1048396 RepID=A0A1H3M4K0_9EURY|nr:hypothetical protein SAMN05216564_108133 [Halopenitus persicus]
MQIWKNFERHRQISCVKLPGGQKHMMQNQFVRHISMYHFHHLTSNEQLSSCTRLSMSLMFLMGTLTKLSKR